MTPACAGVPGCHDLFRVIRVAAAPTTMTRTEHAPVDGTHTTKLRLYPGAKLPVGTPGVSAAAPGTRAPGASLACRGQRTASAAAMTSTAPTPAAIRHRLGSDSDGRKSRSGSRP